MDNIYISFGLLQYGKREIISCSNWKINKDEMGIFIIHGDDSVINGNVALYSQGNEIWKSTIRKAPKRDLQFDFEEENDNIYISSRVLRESDLPMGDNVYEVTLFIDGQEQGAAVLIVEEAREEEIENNLQLQEQSNIIYMPQKISDGIEEPLLCDESYTDSIKAAEIAEELPVEKECEETVEEENKELEICEKESQTEDSEVPVEEAKAEIENLVISTEELKLEVEEPETCAEELGREVSIEESSEDEESEDYTEGLEEMDIKACNAQEEEKVAEMDLKVELFKNLTNYMPLNVSLIKGESLKEYVSMKKSIVIEKIGNFYITVLNDFSNRPAYFLYNGEQIIEWNKSFEEYLAWMKNIVCKMYNITGDEMNRIEKLLIISEEEESIVIPEESIICVKRKEVIKGLLNKYSLIVDLTLDSCSIIYRDEENNNLFMETAALGIKEFVNESGIFTINKGAHGEPVNAAAQWVKHAENVFKPLVNVPVIFTGMAAFPSIYEDLANKFNMSSSLPFISLAWEI